MNISPHENDFGAAIEGVDLSKALSAKEVSQIRRAWLRYRMVYFPDQPMTYEQLEIFTLAIMVEFVQLKHRKDKMQV